MYIIEVCILETFKTVETTKVILGDPNTGSTMPAFFSGGQVFPVRCYITDQHTKHTTRNNKFVSSGTVGLVCPLGDNLVAFTAAGQYIPFHEDVGARSINAAPGHDATGAIGTQMKRLQDATYRVE